MAEDGFVLAGADWIDRFEAVVSGSPLTPRQAVSRLLDRPPAWVSALMTLRNRIVRFLGLKVADPAGVETGFPVVRESDRMIVVGFDDRHLDFRIEVAVDPAADGQRIRVTTWVARHNALGLACRAVVAPLHRRIVPATLRGFCRDIRPVSVKLP